MLEKVKICGGKEGSFFRPADKETKEEHMKFELVSSPEEWHKQSSRNVRIPSKFAYATEYESTSE